MVFWILNHRASPKRAAGTTVKSNKEGITEGGVTCITDIPLSLELVRLCLAAAPLYDSRDS